MKNQINRRRLMAAVALFIFLALSVLAINREVERQFERDVVAINLAGRQRMLSQYMTKVLLQIPMEQSEGPRKALEAELRDAMFMFDQTLVAFERGGMTLGGDGIPVRVGQVSGERAAQLVSQIAALWRPMRETVLPYMSGAGAVSSEVIEAARKEMLQSNLQLLGLTNRLTKALEESRSDVFRWLQFAVMIVALTVFAIIVRTLYLLNNRAVEEGQHFESLATRDPLTGLFNRREFEIALEREFASARRRNGGLALLMIDLDGFKAVNDTHGHAAGDSLLCVVSARISEQARVNDTVARLGGDEFVLICPDMNDRSDAAALSQRLIDALNRPIDVGCKQMGVGASIGIAFCGDGIDSYEELFVLADRAMYAAKQAGRNRYVLATNTTG